MSDLLGFDLPAAVAEPAPQTALPFEPEPETAGEPPPLSDDLPDPSTSVH